MHLDCLLCPLGTYRDLVGTVLGHKGLTMKKGIWNDGLGMSLIMFYLNLVYFLLLSNLTQRHLGLLSEPCTPNSHLDPLKVMMIVLGHLILVRREAKLSFPFS